MIGGLRPATSVRFRHDRSDDVHKLRHAGDFHAVRMVQNGNQLVADN